MELFPYSNEITVKRYIWDLIHPDLMPLDMITMKSIKVHRRKFYLIPLRLAVTGKC
jgi:hypothetical protein